MAYNDTPIGETQSKSVSQPLINENFQILSNFIQQDHNNLNFTGNHTNVTLREIATPIPTDAHPILYTQESPLTTQTELFMTRLEGTSVKIIPLTPMYNNPVNNTGWSYFGNNLLIKWGTIMPPFPDNNGDSYIFYPIAATIPVFAEVYSAKLSVFDDLNPAVDYNRAIRIVDITNSGRIRVYGSVRAVAGNGPVKLTWMAIGRGV